jgi:tRNA(Ile)-lysidine synthase TilS/MesJ
MIERGEIIYYDNLVLKEILCLLENKGIVELTKNKKKANKIAVGDNISTESDKIVHEIIKGRLKNLNIKPVDKNTIKPLFLFLEEEILLYAKLKGIKYKKKSKEDKISKFVNKLEEDHPEIKRAIVNSYLELSN